MAGSARLAHALATVGIALGAAAFFLQRTLGWAGFLAAIVVALVLMLLSFLARQEEVAWRALGNVDYSRDLSVVEGPVDHLDHASYQQFWGGKAGIDATRKLPEEGYTRDGGWPEMIVSDPATAAKVDRRWKEYGL